ncbi:hypothetical protein IFM89_006935 [Coptis chinensis]|uniref:Protein kinase domain-containing protein n=1 Tax=Coptis chinensis TaxID=261450 RepID=A0A835HFP8_9MAGN|nr:hypothetical protein IFM89_006935 [Coptis chinensis]
MHSFQLGHSSFLILLPLFLFISFVASLNSDGLTLLALKSAISKDPAHYLDTWFESDTTPCKWVGIKCNNHNKQVTHLLLSNKSFNGYIPSELSLLTSLTHISLSFNNFTKPIPSSLFNLTSLVSLDLSHNSFTASIPNEFQSLQDLTFLDLSSNLFNGSLPNTLSQLSNLSGTLNLSNNHFSGEIPVNFGKVPVTVMLDLRHNNLSGKIPQIGSLLNQGPTAFAGNPNLCGFPTRVLCSDTENPKVAVYPNPRNVNPKPNYPIAVESGLESGKTSRNFVTVPIISGISFIVGAVSISVWVFRKKWSSDEGKLGKEKVVKNDIEEEQDGKFVVMDEGFVLELEDLLRASAYVVGKSRSGIVYKEFELEMETIASVDHPNIVRLRAYYYASDEKLVVSDFITNGSLYTALHGGPSNSLPPLSWAVRLRIAQGTARGLLYIHECSPRKYVHDRHRHVSVIWLQRRLSRNKLTQKCDVYSFGIVVLELLTGRLPQAGPEKDYKELECYVRKAFREECPLSEIIDPALMHEVHAKKQVLEVFHIALNCTEIVPEMRPRMKTVWENLERVGFH